MAIVCPTITAATTKEFGAQLDRVQSFAQRIHIDLADGLFAPTKLIPAERIYFAEETITDVHVMYTWPEKILETLISLRPHLVIVHAEASGNNNIGACLEELQLAGIQAGVALLPETSPTSAHHLIERASHVLIFGGHLGYQGGNADLKQLEKVTEIRRINPQVEIGWDGGVNETNAQQIVQKGVNVLNVGSFIQGANNPEAAYHSLHALVK
jgi:ribulose-phosphate 3-epimerase